MSKDAGRAGASLRVVAELFLIVVGVLVAFGVESWWSGLDDRRVEAAYVADLREELTASKTLLEVLVGQHETVQDNMWRLDSLLADTDAHPDSIFMVAQWLWPSDVYVPQTPVYDELVSSAGLRTMTSPEVRRALSAYDASLRENRLMDDWFLDSYITSWEPRLATRMPVALFAVIAQDDAAVSELRPLMPPPRALAADLEFRNLVITRAGFEGVRLRQRRLLLDAVTEVLEQLAAVDN